MSQAKLAGIRCGLVSLFLVVWELVTGGIFPGLKLIDPVYVSSPTGIVSSLYHDYPVLFTDAVATLKAAFWGFVIGVIFGVSFGFLFARVPILSLLFDPFFLALNALPRPALAPLKDRKFNPHSGSICAPVTHRPIVNRRIFPQSLIAPRNYRCPIMPEARKTPAFWRFAGLGHKRSRRSRWAALAAAPGYHAIR